MSDLQIIRPRLAFEREFGQHRNWWVRDPRIAGNPLSIYLFLLSHEQNHKITQTEAQKALGLGKDAWKSAKDRLLCAGFLAEVRDRYPEGYVDSFGPRGGQKRFRLILQDPEPGVTVPLEEAIIELECAYEEQIQGQVPLDCGISAVQQSPTADNPQWVEKPQVRASADNPHTGTPTADNPQSFIGIEEMGLDGINSPNPIPSSTSTAREQNAASPEEIAATDARLAAIDPRLSIDSITRQVRGRMNLAGIDLVEACIEILNANQKPGGVKHPAAYVAKSLISDPDRWSSHAPVFGLKALERELNQPDTAFDDNPSENKCSAGIHDWGPNVWKELSRSHCVRCDARRRDVDPAYRELEDEHSQWFNSRSGT